MRKSPIIKALFLLACSYYTAQLLAADTLPNTCPIDGCVVTITEVNKEGTELKIHFDSNFKPDNARNHLHMWWGELYDVKQVSRDAVSTYDVEQGKWHRHDDYPVYITTKSASTAARNGAVTMCVAAADRDHVILDPEQFHCVDVSAHLQN